MKNKELAIKALEAAPGLGIDSAFSTTTDLTKPNCAIGWLYTVVPESERSDDLGVYGAIERFFGVDWASISEPNDNFVGTPEERRDYMINLIKESF